MIEAPEALCLAEQLNETIKGKLVTYVLAGYTPHKFTFFSGKPEEYESRLLNQVVEESHAYGGMIQVNMGDTKLVFSDGANLTYYAPETKLPNKHQLLIGFDDQSCLVVSVRRYGAVWCFLGESFEGNLTLYYESAKRKPQVMSDAFQLDYFLDLMNEESVPNKSVKAFLATDQTIPGLGNGVLQDILYRARIHAKVKISTLSVKQQNELYDHVKNTLLEIYQLRGRDSEKDLFGNKGGYKPSLSKDTLGSVCPCCGDHILKENYLGGSIYYCNTCQKY